MQIQVRRKTGRHESQSRAMCTAVGSVLVSRHSVCGQKCLQSTRVMRPDLLFSIGQSLQQQQECHFAKCAPVGRSTLQSTGWWSALLPDYAEKVVVHFKAPGSPKNSISVVCLEFSLYQGQLHRYSYFWLARRQKHRYLRRSLSRRLSKTG